MELRKTMKAHCNTCNGQRNHELRDQVAVRGRDSENTVEWGDDDYFLRCLGCGSVKILHRSWFSEDTDEEGRPITTDTYFPSSVFRNPPDWIAKLDKSWQLTVLLNEVYRAIQNEAPSLAAMGIRSIIESVMIDKTGDHGTFKNNLAEFQKNGFISKIQADVLQGALELGHASIHRGHVPTSAQIAVSLETVENLVHMLYVLEQDVKNVLGKLPKRGPSH